MAKNEIIRTLVPESDRLYALPRHFGPVMMLAEAGIYNFARGLCKGYTGGFWEFYDLSNGGFYMAPQMDSPVHVEWPDSYYRGDMSADAFGIVVCLFAFSHLSFQLESRPGDRNFSARTQVSEHFHWLREYAIDHPEASAIFAAID